MMNIGYRRALFSTRKAPWAEVGAADFWRILFRGSENGTEVPVGPES
ncbi:hypothetical protein [Aeoliella sp.]